MNLNEDENNQTFFSGFFQSWGKTKHQITEHFPVIQWRMPNPNISSDFRNILTLKYENNWLKKPYLLIIGKAWNQLIFKHLKQRKVFPVTSSQGRLKNYYLMIRKPPKILTERMNGTTCCHLLGIPNKRTSTSMTYSISCRQLMICSCHLGILQISLI